MKYDINQPLSRGVKRTLDSFYQTFFQLLVHQSFDSISVQELCDQADYPRATFYNYFDDKYDLLDYCWQRVFQQMEVPDHVSLTPEEAFPLFFGQTYAFFAQHQTKVQAILRHNPSTSTLYFSFQQFAIRQLEQVFQDCVHLDRQDIPIQLLAKHFANTVLLVLTETFQAQHIRSKEGSYHIFQALIGNQW